MQLRKVVKTVSKFTAYAIGVVIAVVLIAHVSWKYSGSSQWELELEKDDVKIYSRKTPGRALKDFRAVRTVETTVEKAVAAMASTDIEDCADWIPGCASGKTVEKWNPKERSFVHFYQVNYGDPLSPREFLLKTQFARTENNGVKVDFIAVPDRLPRNECCYRIAEMHNTWRYTPIGDRKLQVELQVHMDHGLPYFLINKGAPHGLHQLFTALPRLLNKPKFDNPNPQYITAL